MIRVSLKPEYPRFDADVRAPGKAFLDACPTPTSEQFRKKNYWTHAAKELHAAYEGICAYTAMYLPEQGSVDHFLPKSSRPDLAYEWSNFRLAGGRVNNAKSNQTEILDPFEVQDDWFCLSLPSCLLQPNPSLDRSLKVQISKTINSLRLNQDDSYVQERCNILVDYANEDISIGFLARRYPFLAKELRRQNVTAEDLRALFRV